MGAYGREEEFTRDSLINSADTSALGAIDFSGLNSSNLEATTRRSVSPAVIVQLAHSPFLRANNDVGTLDYNGRDPEIQDFQEVVYDAQSLNDQMDTLRVGQIENMEMLSAIKEEQKVVNQNLDLLLSHFMLNSETPHRPLSTENFLTEETVMEF